MKTDPATTKYPIIEVAGPAAASRKATPSKHSHQGNNKVDVLVESTNEPAKRPNTGIYTSSGKLDEQSAGAQALLKSKDKKAGNCQT